MEIKSFELLEEMRRWSAEIIKARRRYPAQQAGYKTATESVDHHSTHSFAKREASI